MTRAFILRLNPVGTDLVSLARRTGQVSIGWGKCGLELMDPDLEYSAFEAIVHRRYFPGSDHRGSGKAAGQLWRFIREMEPGSMVLIPHYEFFNIVEVTGDVTYTPFTEHWAYRRSAAWWSRPSSVFRRNASPSLQARARTLITCIDATDLLPDILAMVPDAVPTYDR